MPPFSIMMRIRVAMASKTIRVCLVLALLLAAAAGCGRKRELLFEGETMGTRYRVKVVTSYWAPAGPLAAAIEKTLEAVNESMSTYRPGSEISRFNDLKETGRPFEVSDDFLSVMKAAKKLHRLTEGAWDGTLDPLIDLWGFGRSKRAPEIPSDTAVQKLLAQVGFDRIDLSADGALIKHHADVSLDLASIAKGYGVDAVAKVVRDRGFNDFLVEIGGEVYASGARKDGNPWRVGVNVPKADAAFDDIYQVVSLTDRAFATSGDYRNFFEIDGVRYSHIIDPRTGYPVANGVVSASVVGETCTFADGLATALMVMGPGEGVALVDRLNRVECLIIVEKPDGSFVNYYSKGFPIENP